MHISEFLSNIGLRHQVALPTSVRWSLPASGPRASVRARLDSGLGGKMELSIYESVPGDTVVSSAVVRYHAESERVMFPSDDDEIFYERFAETVRLMLREPLV